MPISALDYHVLTSYHRGDMGGHGLDWSNQPGVFKVYPNLDVLPLSSQAKQSKDILPSVVTRHSQHDHLEDMTFDKLCEIIVLSHTVTAKARHGAADFYYRNVASAGALYPFELYVAVKGVSGLDDGLYHHTLGLGGLTNLRTGDIMAVLAEALQANEVPYHALAFFLTCIFFRSSWKYRDRAYRYNLLDTGHLAENLSLALKAHDVPHTFHYDFDDQLVNEILAIDPQREGCLAVVFSQGQRQRPRQQTDRLDKPSSNLAKASQVSSRETGLALINQIHRSSSRAVTRPLDPPDMLDHLGITLGKRLVVSDEEGWSETISYPETLFRRRSKRNFVPKTLPPADLGRLLQLACEPCDQGNGVWSASEESVSMGVLTGHAESLTPGFYLLARKEKRMAFVYEGFLLGHMARICLDQGWLANSALQIVFLSNLELLDQTWGARGYRHAMLTAGRLGQRIYLGATALGLGCCGIGAFYDQEASDLLGINDTTKMLYLVAAGPVKR